MANYIFTFFAVYLVAAGTFLDASENVVPPGSEAVVTLTTDSFDEFVKAHEFSLVEFYAPWCGHCKRLAPEYEAAAQAVKGKVALAKVDATVETELASRFEVHGYPTIKAFRNGKAEDYKGGRTKDTIVQYIESMTGPDVIVAESPADLVKLYSGVTQTAFVGKFKSKDAAAFKVFSAVAKDSRAYGKFLAIFAVDNKDVMVIHREGEIAADPIAITDEATLSKICETERFPYFGPVNANNFADYFASDRQLVWFAGLPSEFEAATKEITVAAKEFRNEYNFVWLNSEEFKDHAEGVLGVVEFPSLVVQSPEGRYMFPEHKFDVSNKLIQFLRDVKAGKIERSLMSEPIPEVNDEAVKIVVGKTFTDMVLQKDKDVMLEVYAPWCGHCKKLEPIYNEFAEALKDSKHLLICKMDGTKNESPHEEFKWTGFPTIFFVKAGSTKPEVFEGTRTLEGLTEYIKEHSSKPLELEGRRDEL